MPKTMKIEDCKYLYTDAGKIEVKDETTLYRCEIGACMHSNAQEKGLVVESCEFSNSSNPFSDELGLKIENIGYDEVSVTYSINECRDLFMPEKWKVGAEGDLEISFCGDRKIRIIADPWENGNKVRLYYTKGESFVIYPGDVVQCEGNGPIKYCVESGGEVVDEWDDSEWT